MMKEGSDIVEKYLFLLLYSDGVSNQQNEPIRGDTWLQKEMFLIFRNIKTPKEEFQPDFYGPFSEIVDEYSEQLEISGYVTRTAKGMKLTPRGEQIASKIWQEENEENKKTIKDVKSFLNDMTIDELLVFIYSTYEKFAEQSEVKDEIECKKVNASISLFKRHKISLKCAANIAKIPLQQYIMLLQNLKIPAYEYTDEELREELASRGADSSQHVSH